MSALPDLGLKAFGASYHQVHQLRTLYERRAQWLAMATTRDGFMRTTLEVHSPISGYGLWYRTSESMFSDVRQTAKIASKIRSCIWFVRP